jgi:hypothetical protein
MNAHFVALPSEPGAQTTPPDDAACIDERQTIR